MFKNFKSFFEVAKKKEHDDQEYLDEILSHGASKAEEIAGKKINEMKKIIGF